MNNENFDKLEAWLEKQPNDEIFDMSFWRVRHPCSTIMCMGGFCQAQSEASGLTTFNADFMAAANWLGINEVLAEMLFHPWPINYSHWKYITPSMALRVVRHFRERGWVNWRAVADEVKAIAREKTEKVGG